MEELTVSVAGNRIYINGKIALFMYTKELKELEEIKKAITLIIVDNSQFYTLYLAQAENDFLNDENNITLIQASYQQYLEFFGLEKDGQTQKK